MSIKTSIIQFLEESGQWEYGGRVAREIASRMRCKESVVERRARELVGILLEHRYVKNPAGGNDVVQYKVIKLEPKISVLQQKLI